MSKKRIQTCWPASVGLRKRFLPPTQYTHRTGRTAQSMLTRAKQRVDTLLEYVRVVGGEWDLGGIEQRLPGRAEDALMVLASNEGLAHQRRGYTVQEVAERYQVSVPEATRAIVTLNDWLLEQGDRYRDDHTVSATTLLGVLKDAHYALEREPIIS